MPISLGIVANAAAAPAYPLKKSANGRYLVDQNNVPYLIMGDSPQALLVNLSEADAEMFLADRGALGFNTVWVNLLCNTYTGGRANGSMLDGTLPFTGTIPLTTSYDLDTPNEAYFAHVDRVLNLAANHGLLVLLDPIETGGWLHDTMRDNGTNKCRAYGQYLGNRYKNFPNIVWMSGNDFQGWRDPNNDAVATAVALGIKDTDTNHIQTVELDFTVSSSLDDSNWTSLIDLNATYTYYPTYAQLLTDYNRIHFLPNFMVEANYEFEDNLGTLGILTPQVLRRQEYWTLLSGAAGQLYGNHYTWQFISEWQANLDTPGAIQFGYVKTLFEPRRWYDLIPDQDHSVVTAGYGTFKSTGSVNDSDFATAARTADGVLVMVYLPTTRTVTVDMSKLSAPATAQWYDPSSGTYVTIAGSPFSNTGPRDFTPSGSNAAGDGDWVLVLESTPTGPSVPSNLTAVPVSPSQINLSWQDNSNNETGFKIERANSASGPWTQIADVGSDATSYHDAGLLDNMPYYYRVKASNAAGDSAFSSIATAMTQSGVNLLGHWAFDEGSGSTALDWSANANDGVVTNATWVSGILGQALDFNGSNAVAKVADSASLSPANAVTVALWIAPNGWDGSPRILQKGLGGGQYKFLGRNGQLWFILAGLPNAVVTTTLPAVGVWSHVAGTYDGTVMKLYLDGQLAGQQAVTGAMPPTAGELWMGGCPGVTNAPFFFDGTIDDIRIYGRPLTQAEIQQLANPSSVVTVLRPNGGEKAPAGRIFSIVWGAPTNAVSFRVRCSTDGGTNWTLIATDIGTSSYDWLVPPPTNNLRSALIKVQSFDASGARIGIDTSDNPFTIDVARVITPNGGETLQCGTTTNITWETYSTPVPVASVALRYSLTGTAPWNTFAEVAGNPGSFSWTVPTVLSPTGSCKVKITLKDEAGLAIGSGFSDDYFIITP